jgi:hypothetical protein
MRRSSAAKKVPPPIRSLADRITALKEEVEDELSRLAEEKRPAGVPGPWLRQNWMARAGGNPFEAYLVAVKEFPQ